MTYKIMIVDDEPLIARSVSRIIQKTNPSYKIAAICYNGKEALEHIETDLPDLVITDIQMPVMNGLELIHKLRHRYPSIHIVILSGYDDFKYAQTAIHEGVRDYLLKPLNHKEVSELLTSLEQELEINHQSSQIKLWNQLVRYPDSARYKDIEIKNELPYPSYLLMLTCCGPYFHSISTPSEELNLFWESNYLFESCWELLPDIPFWIIDCGQPNEKLIIISCENDAEFPDLENTASALHTLFCQNDFPITTIITEYRMNDSLLPDIIAKMRQYLRQNLLFGKSSFHSLSSSGTSECTLRVSSCLTQEKKKLIPLLFTEKQKEKLYLILKESLQFLSNNDCPQILLETYMKQIVSLILTEINMDNSLFLYQNMIYDICASATQINHLEDAFLELLDELFALQDTANYNALPQNLIAQNVHDYISSHYTEPINIQTVASRFGVVAPYLSKLYFDYYHIPLKKDILNMRIQKAEELLKITPSIPLREIAEQTGFNDQFYFSKVFKQQHSISPIEYRKLINGNADLEEK